jgi:hypothetical protein
MKLSKLIRMEPPASSCADTGPRREYDACGSSLPVSLYCMRCRVLCNPFPDTGTIRERKNGKAVYQPRGGSSSSLYTVIVHFVRRAAIAPTAARTGASRTPTTPIVSGMVISSLPSLLLMTSLRMLPALTSSLTRARSSSPLTRTFFLVHIMLLAVEYQRDASG